MTLEELRAKLQEIHRQSTALHEAAKDRAFTEEEKTRWDALLKEFVEVRAQIEREEELARHQPLIAGDQEPAQSNEDGTPVVIDVPLRGGPLRNFQEAKEAYRFGQFALAVRGNQRALQWCHANGMPDVRAMHTGENSAGGVLVPEEFDARIVMLIERRGVFRPNANNVNMQSDVKSYSKHVGDVEAYHTDELQDGTPSDMTFLPLLLVAKKVMGITVLSTELNEDAVVSVGDLVVGSMARAFARREDRDGFLGDGTSAYGGFRGIIPLLTAATAGLETAASGTHTNWAGITLANFDNMVAKIPDVVQELDLKWYCTRAFFYGVMVRLLHAAGGNTQQDLAGGPPKGLNGYPVEFVGVMPKTAASAQVVCMLGDLKQAADFGDRRGRTLRFATEGVVGSVNLLTADGIGVVATERYAITVHSVGDTSDAGPVVGLLTAS